IVAAPAATVTPPPEAGPKLGSLFSNERRGAVSPFVHELWGASAPGTVQRAVPAGLFEPAAAQPSAAQPTTPAAVSPTASAARPSPEPFNFLRPVAPNQGAWPICEAAASGSLRIAQASQRFMVNPLLIRTL